MPSPAAGETYPAYRSAEVDPAGRVWIALDPDFENWLVFGPDFGFLGRYQVKNSFFRPTQRIAGRAADYFVIDTSDGEGVPLLRFYRYAHR